MFVEVTSVESRELLGLANCKDRWQPERGSVDELRPTIQSRFRGCGSDGSRYDRTLPVTRSDDDAAAASLNTAADAALALNRFS